MWSPRPSAEIAVGFCPRKSYSSQPSSWWSARNACTSGIGNVMVACLAAPTSPRCRDHLGFPLPGAPRLSWQHRVQRQDDVLLRDLGFDRALHVARVFGHRVAILVDARRDDHLA